MDPLTLFALANGAVKLVKEGCKLYKDIKGAAGDIKDVLADLDDQFAKKHKNSPPTIAVKNQYIAEKNRVIELNKKANAGQHTSVYTEIGEKLGEYYDNFYKCQAIMEEEERRAEHEVYTGDASLGKRALQRVLMRKQLEQMSVELRELMVYQSPPELGALYSDVSEMMTKIQEEQRIAITKQMRENERLRKLRKKKVDQWLQHAILGLFGIYVSAVVGLGMVWVINDRIEKYPHLGTDFIPKTEAQRKRDAEPKIYIGR